MGKNNFNKNVATAPYNFVPLNSTVISDNDSSVVTGIHDSYDYFERLTGYIECKLETLTPIYIRGGLTEEEVKAKKEAKDNSNFFSPAGQIRIPGSSLRGMIRTLVEIASWGKFGFFEDRNLYFRGFADNCKNLREEYDSQMKPFDKESKRSIYKMSAGYMVKEGFKYFIYPAEKTGDKDKQFYNIKIEKASEEIKEIGKKRENYNYYKLKDGRSIVVSGPMSNRKDPELSKKHDWIINKIDRNIQNKIEIPEIDIQNYNRDESRGNKVPDLLKQCYDDKEVPCFYVEWLDGENNNRVSFGNTALFRISYQKSIGDHIPINGLKNKEKIDFANAIFGNTFEGEKDPDIDPIAGRVFFEDAKLVNPNNNCLMKEESPGILLGPKPTSFQLYLEQDSNLVDELKHYNSGTRIRGNKFYWHKSGEKWEYKHHNLGNSNEKIKTKIRPVKPNTEFKFRIRYENLSESELGALLFALKLPEGCAHKIGMGKPYGLGSVKIIPELYTSDRNGRYLSLFNRDGWVLAEFKQKDRMLNQTVSAFEEHILEGMSDSDKGEASSLWETHRLKQLKKLLEVEKGKELERDHKSEYTDLKKFRYRDVLPIPEDI
ncbi:DUF324 domain-containing protein [Methanosarcina siciliae HI350]|uniref:DUF324 domain-containing protein n=1 Tax=Methanosarcina siciliae HI350 TaxID=1434119 RepID=A0A0E3PE79_9EURY|nr:TIGR03986 family CRISPR-associated RAMP protein [Methanosarcina siciliae]AKB32500.1 DUF324 domain-containing protein [Methanosarcina siciliae HI350]